MADKQLPHSGYVMALCFQCGEYRSTRKGRANLRCNKCRISNMKGRHPATYKGGEITHDGRVFIWCPDVCGYKQRSRIVMEKVLGRPLLKEEDVHHKNEIKNDDSSDNLEVLLHGVHTAITNRQQQKAARMQEFRWKKK